MIKATKISVTKHKDIINNTFFTFGLNIIQSITGFAVIYVLVRTLSQTEFGYYQLVLSLAGVFTIFSLPGLNNAVLQSVARGNLGTFLASLKLSFLTSLIGSLILLIIALWYFFYSDSFVYIAFIIAAVTLPFAHGLKRWKAVKMGNEEFLSLLLIDGFSLLLTAMLVIVSTLAAPGSILWPLAAALFVPSILNVIVTVLILQKVEPGAQIEEGSVLYGVKTTLFLSVNVIANQLDKLLIFGFFSPTSLAIYFAAERISEFAKSMGQNVATVLAPRFSKTEKYTQKLDQALTVFSIVLGVFIIVFAFTLLPTIINLLFGESYIAAIPYAQVLLITVSLANYSNFKYRYVISKLDKKSYRDVMVGMSISRIIFSVSLVPLYGILGAVISTALYRVVTVLIVQYVIKMRYLKK